MKKKNFPLGSAIVLCALLTTPAFAGEFQANIFCDPPPGHGKGKIGGKGTGQFQVQGLPPNETFTCAVECLVLGDSVEQSCTSDSRGRLAVTFEQELDVCLGAVLVIKQEPTILCASGFVSVIPTVPHP